MNIRRFLATAAVTVLVLAGTAGPARADETFGSPPGLLYICSFPGVAPQQVTVVAGFTGPSGVAAGEYFSITDISGKIVLNAVTRSLLRSVGYDGVRGRGMIPVTAWNATELSKDDGFVWEQIWPPDSGTIEFWARSQLFSAGNEGTAGLMLSRSFSLSLEFHKHANNMWTPWFMNCTLKVTNPPQNPAFTPDLLVY
ncbi:hypothetical protein SAMN04489727_2499 [Amycolatopsis tolypomycina]|uniref:DUF6801 domain-containing protein n=1 Tax=Amycolatopsis tolypomycina TaxID=208445 RepID=A0A1H4PMG9_9PSEU|nr:DUF6801 domain-containing protein [Amycolatopsis tolypomycina]SEC08438.1 hypothetical protein SAMN04489727_2499 [Amycolatopsis tolypomycina]